MEPLDPVKQHRLPACALVVLVCLGCPATALALKPVVVNEEGRINLGPHLEFLADTERKWTIAEISSAELSSRFEGTGEDVPNFGFTTVPHWFRVELESASGTKRRMLLEVAFPVLDRIDVYVGKTDGSFEKTSVGEIFPHGNKVMRHHNFVIPIEIESRRRKTVYLRIETEGVLQVPLRLWSPESFFENESEIRLFFGVFFGFLTIGFLYNLFIFLVIRDRSYLYLVSFAFCGIVVAATHVGVAQQYAWSALPWVANRALPVGVCGLACSLLLFTRRFLDVEKSLPSWKKPFSVMVSTFVVGFAASVFAPYNVAIVFVAIVSTLVLSACLSVAFVAWWRGFTPARYYLIAWASLLLVVFVTVLNKFGLIPRSVLTEYAYMIGGALGFVLFSLALADRINILRIEKDVAQSRAVRVHRQAAESLEQKVRLRTRELEQAYERLAEHDRLKSRFFANVSHELRTPLTLILTPLERLLSRDLARDPEATRQQLRSMTANTHRLLRLVNQLLDFSRLESGAASLVYERLDIRMTVEALVHRFLPFARSKGLRLETRLPDELPMIYADPAKLERIINNLLSNACKFTEPGGTVLVRCSSDEGSLRIAVKDTGIGIAEKDLSMIFERFGQADGSAARRYEGTGIGLALSQELAQLMNGKLEVESELDVGSTFTVVLPLGRDHIKDPARIRSEPSEPETTAHADPAAALAAETGLQEAPAAEEPPDEAKPLLLVVEDNPDMRSLVAEICREEFRIAEAENGRVGLERIREIRPAIVVLDVMMPEMDGHEVMRRLRADPATASLPVIMLTARAGPELKLEGLESGADDYLAKPFQSRELLARVRNLVRLQRSERELRELNARLQQEVVEQATALEHARALQRYLPPQVARKVLEEGPALEAAQERRRLTVFRLELRGFGELARQADAEDMATMLNAYLSEIVDVAFEHGATVDKLIRDTVTGFVGAPESAGPEKDAARCAELAIDMWAHAREVCERWRSLLEGNEPPTPTMILCSGRATVGNFGSSNRLEYTAVGGPVDEAAELLPRVKPGQVVCSQSTWALADGQIVGKPSGEVTVAGGTQPVKLFRIAGPARGAAQAAEAKPKPDFQQTGPVQPTTEVTVGKVLAERYTIVRVIGEGGMGTVYQARDLKLGTDVALKILRREVSDDEDHRARLYREVKLAQMVSHRNVARIFDLQFWGGHEFISMEYIDGVTLADRLEERGALAVDEVSELLRQICAGLAAAHAANIVHRDLKPLNIMLEAGGRVVIMDFGVARWDAVKVTQTQGLVGSPYYMAPEQFKGAKVDHRADIYSLGVLAFELFTGERLFESESAVGLAWKHNHQPPRDLAEVKPDVPPRLAAVIMRCLAKAPAERFGSVVEIASLLDGAS